VVVHFLLSLGYRLQVIILPAAEIFLFFNVAKNYCKYEKGIGSAVQRIYILGRI
jgi:hypothetical protein